MKRILSILLLLSVLPVFADPEIEQENISILKSDAKKADKALACKKLAVWGSDEAVPVLAPLLADAELASWARIALEALPGSTAEQALRDAVPNLEGRLLVGVLNSIGVRRDAKAVPLLSQKLQVEDADTASAAAAALGRIGNGPAVEALLPMLKRAPKEVLPAVAEGCIRAAEQRLQRGESAVALSVYQAVREANVSKQKTREALRGEILSRKSDGLNLLVKQLQSEDWEWFSLGLHVAREIPGAKTARVLQTELERAVPERRIALLRAMAERGDAQALPAAMRMAESGPESTRLMAIEILNNLADPASIMLLLRLAGGTDKALGDAARKGLARMPGKETDAAVVRLLRDPNPDTRVMAINLLSQRRVEGMVDTLIKASADPEQIVRRAALKAVGRLGGTEDVKSLLKGMAGAREPADIRSAEQAVLAICMRDTGHTGGSIKIIKAVYGDLPDGKRADVTRKVAGMVKKGQREIEASNSHFGDPAGGVLKKLQVDFKVGGKVNSKTVNESETLVIVSREVPPACTESVLHALSETPSEPKQALLRILQSFGGREALAAIRQAAGETDEAVKDAALRALFDWPDTDALPDLAQLARNAPSSSYKILALRGYIRLVGQADVAAAQKMIHLKDAMSLASRPEEQRLVLGALGSIPTREALAEVTPYLGQPALKEEAAAAVLAIAGALKDRSGSVREAIEKARQTSGNPQLKKQAAHLL
jgi:HEAT repeat protein